jgi:hypothetical protein
MPFTYNWAPNSYYFNSNDFYTTNLQVNLSPSSYTGSGTIWENTQNSTEATLINNPTYSSRGFTLNGTTQYAVLNSVAGVTNFTTSNNYTIEVWCNINSVQQDTLTVDNAIVEKWNSTNEGAYPYVVRYIRDSGNVNFAVYNGISNPISSVSATLNNWAQYVGVFNHSSDILSVYKNGQLANTGAMVITGTISNSSTLNLGRRANAVGGGNIYFTGSIGIVRIYSEALNATQVLQNYNANKSIFGLS